MTPKSIISFGKQLVPIYRSLTGNGIRQTLRLIKKQIPNLKICEVKSKTRAYDWKVPSEWNVNDAFVSDKKGNKIIDFQKNNLHLIVYSVPIKKRISKAKLLDHIETLPAMPNAIPYVTSYYKKYWGFCISDNQKKKIEKNYKKNDKFFVNINSTFKKNGSLTYGELIIPGKSKKEILISTYICHPQMANDGLSGPLMAMAIAKHFSKKKNYKTLRIIFIPETIGSIVYINKNLKKLKKNVIGGYVFTCIGDEGQYSFLPTKYGNTLSDEAAKKAFADLKISFKKYSFLKRGSDERQFNSPGVDLPIASILRTKYSEFNEYHTSLDNFKLVTARGFAGGFKVAKKAIDILMSNTIPESKYICEPQMQKKNLYHSLSTKKNMSNLKIFGDCLNFLQYSDGSNDLVNIAKYIKLSFNDTLKIFEILKKKKMLK